MSEPKCKCPKPDYIPHANGKWTCNKCYCVIAQESTTKKETK